MKNSSCWLPCMKSKAWHARGVGLMVLSFLILTWSIVVSVLIVAEEYSLFTTIAVTIILAFGLGQYLFFLFLFLIEKRAYHLDENGITILYGGLKQRFYHWSVFQEIVVCDFNHASKYPPNCFLIIRLSSDEEPYGPNSKQQKYTLAGIESWRGYFYTMRHFSGILFLEYSPALLEEIKKASALQVKLSLTKYGKAKMKCVE